MAYNATYAQTDIKPITLDIIGKAGAAVAENVDLLVFLVVIGAIVSLAVGLFSYFKYFGGKKKA